MTVIRAAYQTILHTNLTLSWGGPRVKPARVDEMSTAGGGQTGAYSEYCSGSCCNTLAPRAGVSIRKRLVLEVQVTLDIILGLTSATG